MNLIRISVWPRYEHKPHGMPCVRHNSCRIGEGVAWAVNPSLMVTYSKLVKENLPLRYFQNSHMTYGYQSSMKVTQSRETPWSPFYAPT